MDLFSGSRLATAFAADERHIDVEVAWQCAQQLRSVYHQPSHADGRRIAEKVLASFPSCPIPEIARLGRTLNQWKEAFLNYFTTGGANNGGTAALKCRCRHLMAYADVWIMPTVTVFTVVRDDRLLVVST